METAVCIVRLYAFSDILRQFFIVYELLAILKVILTDRKRKSVLRGAV